MTAAAPERLLVLACGALAREVLALVRANRLGARRRALPAGEAPRHARPDPAAVDEALVEAIGRYDRVFVGYADCGTAGALDGVLERHGAERLPGAHCYAVYAGLDEWDALQDEEPGTYYLTDFLVRHFDSLVVRPLGLDRHPELRDDYFGNYRRVALPRADRRPGAARAAPRLRGPDRTPVRASCRRATGCSAARSPPSWRSPRLPELTVISWRDIPAQVTATDGERNARAALTDRFLLAIDEAAMRAGLSGSDDYLAEWQRETRECGADLEREVADEVARLEEGFPPTCSSSSWQRADWTSRSATRA